MTRPAPILKKRVTQFKWTCGLVDIKSPHVLTTRLGEELASTRSGVQRDIRLAKAFLNVPLFREVYKRYENATLPSTREGLKQALEVTFGVSSKRVSSALKTLEASAEQAGFKRQDPNRLIHPVPIGLMEADTLAEARLEEERIESTSMLQPEVARKEEMPERIHPAISGFLQELPSKGERWNEGERKGGSRHLQP